jgi:hypothetical protein
MPLNKEQKLEVLKSAKKHFTIFTFAPYAYAIMVTFKLFDQTKMYAISSVILLLAIKAGYKNLDRRIQYASDGQTKPNPHPILIDIATMVMVLTILFEHTSNHLHEWGGYTYLIQLACYGVFIFTYFNIKRCGETLTEKGI